MQVGDLVKLITVGGGTLAKLRGIVYDIDPTPPAKTVSVLWTDGDRTKEFPVELEAVCK
jgi:FAD/FMN-containing dehydrogenase|tara:strand:+ start:530 stop:706 length:177 start_codon:yes stop_codon:yes gene_type:complete